ncbi:MULTISPECIES: flagellar basal body rod protein FlgG [Fictibacillus]|uniref:flagellar basal body rod protein FlgG n=1 Tax=Fictibacillus TaxID=1329200 RepID=UPI0011A80195|nr:MULTISPECIES: flagellar basal body rod protein FlgG [Fictibacillus]MBH0167738.1 flagellar basal body rod protein FlgG [Fictibacillus sp. 18YEL24]
MLRSMYSGISGMKNFQVKLDVIGNNIANVNTYGFKKGRTTFKDLVSQQIAGASEATATRGGVNPKQVGLGSQLSTIDTVHTQGSLQNTARPLDLGISGDGFFRLGTGTIAAAGGVKGINITLSETTYSRAGNFYLDQEGYIVNSDGKYLLGPVGTPATTSVAIKIPTDAKSFSVGADGTVNYIDKDGKLTKAGQIELAKFSNNEGLEKAGSNEYRASTNSGNPLPSYPGGTGGAGTLVAGALEMSNVDLSEEFTEMIVAQRGFQANTRIITTSDEILQELVNLKR